MRMFKNYILSHTQNPIKYKSTILMKSNKNILYETIDFTFKPNHYYTLKTIKPSLFDLPKTTYEKQYEFR